MTRLPVPIANLQRRLPESGRIRFGVKTAKAMKAIDTFRFTSHDPEALRQVAELYEGEVKPWSDPKAAPGQYELITQASEIEVVLPPDPLGGTPIYEKWGGGGCERRCDGLSCQILVAGPEGPEQTTVDCMCIEAGALACKVKTRLNVMLAGVRFGGVWRLETSSDNAAKELPGMVELIQSLQEKGLVRAVLALKHRRSVVLGQTHNFIVPVLGVAESLDEIAAGAARLGALPTGAPTTPVGELGSGNDDASQGAPEAPPGTESPFSDPDNEVTDAEIIDDGPTHADLAVLAGEGPKRAKALKAARTAATELDIEAPSDFDEITDPTLVLAAMAAVQ